MAFGGLALTTAMSGALIWQSLQSRVTAFDRGAQAGTSHWTGILTVKLKPPASAEVLRKNPLGLYVDAIDWSREIEPAANPAVSSRAAARPVQPAPEVSITAATDGAASASPIPANPENRQ
ncbi:VirB8/TrbF family protein [Sphingomonas koreensis]|uniref:VirB8/TrbF family protein n=1 Tax=Sphingomonas koreensis TaxID=93064 RepID=UPI00234EC8EB|nr:VirB8/TrbF family protein [Sphingomonas koreensis]MDC7810854.1 VirB8/TrbF family protein [Sphingomonas koreensis]